MPHFKISTNLSKDKVPPTFLKETVKLIASMLGKPEEYCVVSVVPDQMMHWGCTTEGQLCAIASLMSIGRLGVAENKKYSNVLGEHVEKHLGIPADHMYIEFIDSPSSVVGYNKTTFHDILG